VGGFGEAAEGDTEEDTSEQEVQITVNVPVDDEDEEAFSGETPEEKKVSEEENASDEPEPEGETTVVSQITSEPEEEAEAKTEYTLLPGDCSSLCLLKLETGRVRVVGALVAAIAGSLELRENVLEGEGEAWMGQGSLTPVVIGYSPGMTVRMDRIGAMPLELFSESLGIVSAPSLRRLLGNGECRILMFVSGRYKKIEAQPGLCIRAGSVLAAGPSVEFADDGGNFLTVSGGGTIYISA
jgi:hypothetical protein